MKTWKRLSTGAVVAFGFAALVALSSVSSVQAGDPYDPNVTLTGNGCRITGTDLPNSCTMTESGVDCGGMFSLPLPPDTCAFWQFEMKRGNDFVCVQNVDLSAHNPKLSLPIRTGLGTDTVCVGGVAVGDGVSDGGWMTIRSENGDDNIDVGDCSCNGAVGDTEVYGPVTIATGRGNDSVTVDNATFHSDASIRVGSGADNVTVSDAILDGELEILAGTNPENTDVDTVTLGTDVDIDGEVLIRTGGGDDSITIAVANFADQVEIYAGPGNDSVTLTDVDCEGVDLPIEVDCGADGGTLTCSGVDQSCGGGDTDCCDVINVNGDCTEFGC